MEMTTNETERSKRTEAHLMAAMWTRAGVVRRAAKSGRPRKSDLRLPWKKALLQGLIAQEDIQDAMRYQGLPAEDVRVSLVVASTDLSSGSKQVHVWRLPMTLEEVPARGAYIASLEETAKLEALGLIFVQRDRDVQTQIPGRDNREIWTERWLVGEDAQAAMSRAASEGATSLDHEFTDREGIVIPLN